MKIAINAYWELSAFDASDVGVLADLAHDPAIYQMTMDIPYPYTRSDAMDWIAVNRELRQKYQTIFSYAIRNHSGELVGSIGRRMAYGFAAHQDEIGYWIGAPFRGQGIMKQVLPAYVSHLREREGLTRISALVFPDNLPSIRVLEASGFTKEGHLHRYLIKDGAYKDVLLYAIW